MILEKRLHLIPRKRQRHAQAVAVVVVRDVLAPVEQRRRLLVWICLPVVVLVDRPVAAIDFKRRSDHHDHVLANRFDERRVLDRKPIRKLHQHLRRAGFR